MVIKIVTKLGRRMNEQSENFNKENIRKYQIKVTELKNTVTVLKNTVKVFMEQKRSVNSGQ